MQDAMAHNQAAALQATTKKCTETWERQAEQVMLGIKLLISLAELSSFPFLQMHYSAFQLQKSALRLTALHHNQLVAGGGVFGIAPLVR